VKNEVSSLHYFWYVVIYDDGKLHKIAPISFAMSVWPNVRSTDRIFMKSDIGELYKDFPQVPLLVKIGKQ
jgi:hypothetical protein